MKCHGLALIDVLILTLLPLTAHAQSNGIKEITGALIEKVGIHGNISYRYPFDSDVRSNWGKGVSMGLSPGRTNGRRYPFALTLFTQGLTGPNGEGFASVRTWAILGGIGYGWHFGRFSPGVQMQTGYAFNHATLEEHSEHAFNVPNGTVSVNSDNSWLLRPEIKAEYFITHKFTVRVSGDYVYMRPGIVVTTPNQRLERQWDESNLHANFGVAFYPFRKP